MVGIARRPRHDQELGGHVRVDATDAMNEKTLVLRTPGNTAPPSLT